MNKILSIQRAFVQQLTNGTPELVPYVQKTNKLGVSKRIDIYADGYLARLIEAFTGNYSKLQEYMGENNFYKLAKKYLSTNPSTFRSIRQIGNKLPTFLSEDPQFSKKAVLSNLARFEWTVEDTFDAPDALPLTPESFKNIPPKNWGKIKLVFHPSVRYEKFAYDIIPLWESLLKGEVKRVRRLNKPYAVLFWRFNLVTVYKKLSEVDASVLELAVKGEPFIVLCQCVGKFVPENEAPGIAASLLMSWVASGLIIGVSLK